MDSKVTPLFLLGTARSGTTWLANLLVDHPAICGVTGRGHNGIHESHVFDHTKYVFTSPALLCSDFLNLYQKENYFQLLEIDCESFCQGRGEKRSVVAWFCVLMDEYARRQNALYWLEKTPKHAIYFDEILDAFPDAKFVLIQRKFRPTILSNLTKYGRPRSSKFKQIIEKVMRYEVDRKAIYRVRGRVPERAFFTYYESLLQDSEAEIKQIGLFLGVENRHLVSQYPADSSYKRGKKKYQMTKMDWVFAYSVWFILRIMPFSYSLLVVLRKKRDRMAARVFPKYPKVTTN